MSVLLSIWVPTAAHSVLLATAATHCMLLLSPHLHCCAAVPKPAAARTKLRKLLADKDKAGAAGGVSAASGSAAERSPHAKSSYDAAEFGALVKVYEGLKWRMISKPGGATVKPDDFYR